MIVQSDHWGRWVLQTALVCGFRSQADLAREVGMKPESVCRLVHRAIPTRLRLSTIEGLCRALNVDQATLLRGWRNLPSTPSAKAG